MYLYIFKEILYFLETGRHPEPITLEEQQQVMMRHVRQLHQFYGDDKGVLFARKHVGWYLAQHGASASRREFNQVSTAQEQYEALEHYFDTVFCKM